MNIYEMFGTDDGLEVDGFWKEFGDTRIRLARAGGKNSLYGKVVAKERAKFTEDVLEDDAAKQVLINSFAKGVIKGWEIKNKKGEWESGIMMPEKGEMVVKPFSVNNVKKVLNDIPDLMTQLLDITQKRANYQKDLEEDILGN